MGVGVGARLASNYTITTYKPNNKQYILFAEDGSTQAQLRQARILQCVFIF